MKNIATSLGFIVWGLGSLFFLAEYFVRISTGVLSSDFLDEFQVKAAAVGLLSGFFYYSYISMQIPVGILVDRFGTRKLLSLSCIIFGLACFLFSTIQNLELGYLSRFIMGFVGAFAFVSTLKLITIYFPAHKFALLAGITQGGGMVGAVIGAAPMAQLFSLIGWRSAFVGFSMLFIGLGILMFLLIRDQAQTPNATRKKNSLILDLKIVLSSKQTWLNCLFIGLVYAPTEVFGEQWGTLFFHNLATNINIEKAALQGSFIFIGMAIGCPLIGYISDRLKNRVKVMRLCSLACLILLSTVIYSKHILNIQIPYAIICMMMLVYGIFASAIIPAYAIATEVNPKEVSGMALGITNMACVIIGSIFIPIVGSILDQVAKQYGYTSGSTIPIQSFYIAFILLPISFVGCFLLTFFIQETHCKPLEL